MQKTSVIKFSIICVSIFSNIYICIYICVCVYITVAILYNLQHVQIATCTKSQGEHGIHTCTYV